MKKVVLIFMLSLFFTAYAISNSKQKKKSEHTNTNKPINYDKTYFSGLKTCIFTEYHTTNIFSLQSDIYSTKTDSKSDSISLKSFRNENKYYNHIEKPALPQFNLDKKNNNYISLHSDNGKRIEPGLAFGMSGTWLKKDIGRFLFEFTYSRESLEKTFTNDYYWALKRKKSVLSTKFVFRF